MSEFIKHCPFCGGRAIIRKHDGAYCVVCIECDCIARMQLYVKKEEAIESWNTRKPIERIVERLEELFKYNSEQADIYRDGADTDAYFREKKDMYMDRANCYGVAIRTVKEEGE